MLKVLPLGGLGEIGLNSLAFEYNREIVLVDAGLMFPTAQTPGVDVLVPDFSYLLQDSNDLKAVVLTHGHEDHIGALPFLLKQINVPVYGTKLTLAWVKNRLEDHPLKPDLREVSPGEIIRLCPSFEIEAFRVSHSIPDGVGYIIKTPEGTVVHTGDFNLDPSPLYGSKTDLDRLGEVGERGVLCLFSDSTNAEEPEILPSESEVGEAFEGVLRQCPGRLIVALFASHLYRIQHLLVLAERAGRKVALQGRSMARNVAMAVELGFLNIPRDLIVSLEDSARLPDAQVLILSTGAQGEPHSGLQQLSWNEMPAAVRPGDTVVLSARAIPGNERAIGQLINQLYRQGALVLTPHQNPHLHVSGHATRPQQRRLMETVRPSHFVPIHGEARHLVHHLQLAEEADIAPSGRWLMLDGQVLGFEEGRGKRQAGVNAGRILLDQWSRLAIDSDAVKQRLQMSSGGVVVALVQLTRSTSNYDCSWSGVPQLHGRGLSAEETRFLNQAGDLLLNYLKTYASTLLADDAVVKEEVVRGVRFLWKQHRYNRPYVIPLVIRSR